MRVQRRVAAVASVGMAVFAVSGAAVGSTTTSTRNSHNYGAFSYSALPTSMYAVSSDKPLPTTITETQAESGVVGKVLKVPGDVAGGYTLHGNKINDYNYRSDNGYYWGLSLR